MINMNSDISAQSRLAKLRLYDYLIVLVLFYLVFKPMELMSMNYYLPIYVFSIPAGVWFLRHLFINWNLTHAWLLTILLGLMTLLGCVSAFSSLSVNFSLIFTWPAWFCVMSLGIFLASRSNDVSLFMPQFFKAVLVVESAIVLIQLFYPDAFDLLWSSEKTNGFESYVRVTGSAYNPNFFAIIITFCTAGIVASKGLVKSSMWVLLGYTLVLLSGSRTLIIGMPLVLGVWFYINSGSITPKILMKAGILTMSMFSYAFIMMNAFETELRYVGQLQSSVVGNSVDLSNINSYATRQQIWTESMADYFERDFWDSMIGTHDNSPVGRNPHQNFLYILNMYGLFGVLVHVFMIAIILSIAYTTRVRYESKLLYLTVIMLIGYGLADKSLGKMTFGVFFAFMVGLVMQRLIFDATKKIDTVNS